MGHWTGLKLWVLVSILAGLPACRTGERYPDRPILLVCPWAVGGGTDRISRQLAAFLELELGVPVNVINATGGAGVTGHSRGAGARPDGYTLTLMTVELNMLHWQDLTEISWTDFAPLALINKDPAAIFVRSDDPRWSSLADLAAAIGSAPGTLTASGTASGGIWHLAVGGWLSAAGLGPDDIRWIPMNGASPALQELASGGIDFVSCSLPEAGTLLQGGKVRALGVMAEERLPEYPDVPTLQEQGIPWQLAGWRGVGVPRGTPEGIQQTLLQALGRIVRGETRLGGRTFPEFMRNEGFNVVWEPPGQCRRTLEITDRNLGEVLNRPEFASVRRGLFEPMAFPHILAILLALNLAVLLLSGLASPEDPDSLQPEWSRGGLARFLEIVAAACLYILAAETLGFLLTAGILLVLLLWRLGTRLSTSLLVTLLLVPAVYQLFGNLLRVPLPRGILWW